MTRISVLLADDHPIIREGLRLLVDAQADMQVVEVVGDGQLAWTRAAALRPQVVVMDLSMPNLNGLAATRAVRKASPATAVVILTRHNDMAYVREILEAGALGYVLKQSAPDEILRAIRAAATGRQFLDSTLRLPAPSTDEVPQFTSSLAQPQVSDREAEVLRLIAWGYSNKEIATRLDLSVKTVEVHRANAIRKLGLRDRVDIVRFAQLQGWLDTLK